MAPTTQAPSDPPEARASRPRDERPVAIVPSSQSRREDARPRDQPPSASGAKPIKRKSSAQKAFVSKFDDKLTSEVTESSRRSDPIVAISDCVEKLIEVTNLGCSAIFSGYTFVVAKFFFIGLMSGLLGKRDCAGLCQPHGEAGQLGEHGGEECQIY